MNQLAYASPWRKFSLRLTALVIIAVAGGWAMSTVLASKPSTVGARAPAEAAAAIIPAEAAISPMELMINYGRPLPATEYVEPF